MVVLSHSRLLWLRFSRRQTMAVLTEGLERAFARFGGVPKERLFDQMRAVVLSDGRVGGGELVLNAEFLRVAAHWGFHPRACRPYRAQTKGKVERPIRYIRDSFFYGRAFANDEDLNEQASRWLEGTATVRRHSTTGERPVDRFERDEREEGGSTRYIPPVSHNTLSECSVDHSSGLVFCRPQALPTAALWSILAPPFSMFTLQASTGPGFARKPQS